MNTTFHRTAGQTLRQLRVLSSILKTRYSAFLVLLLFLAIGSSHPLSAEMMGSVAWAQESSDVNTTTIHLLRRCLGDSGTAEECESAYTYLTSAKVTFAAGLRNAATNPLLDRTIRETVTEFTREATGTTLSPEEVLLALTDLQAQTAYRAAAKEALYTGHRLPMRQYFGQANRAIQEIDNSPLTTAFANRIRHVFDHRTREDLADWVMWLKNDCPGTQLCPVKH